MTDVANDLQEGAADPSPAPDDADRRPPGPEGPGLLPSTPRHRAQPALWVAVVLGGVVIFGSIVARGELGAFFLASWESVPLVFLCVTAYFGMERLWGRVLSRLLLAAFVTGGIVVDAIASGLARMEFGAGNGLATGAWREIGLVVALASLAAFGAVAVNPLAHRLHPGDQGFVRRIALMTLVAFTGLGVAPLLILGEPPILAMFRTMIDAGIDPTEGRGNAGALRDTVYAFCWNLPAALFAVGYGVRRSFRESIDRLGLAWPTRRQLIAAVGLTIALFGCMWLLEPGIDALWTRLGWPTTDLEALESLLGFALSVPGAVIVAIVAGVGEEVAVRGVLQPRLGIVPSNMFFTALHAYQYNWDALLSVFFIGLVFGLIRQRTNTSVSAVVHGGYDFLAIMATLVERG